MIHMSKKYNVGTSTSKEKLNTPTDESFLSFQERKLEKHYTTDDRIAELNILNKTANIILDLFQDKGEDPKVIKIMSITFL